MEGNAYGAGMAGKPFDVLDYIKKPSVILRFISWVFAIIVFACISAEKEYSFGSYVACPYGGDSGACGFGIFVGVIAFLACMVFLVMDAMFDNWSNVQHRKMAVMADLIFSGIWTFMYFVCFCYLTNKWVGTTNTIKNGPGVSSVQAAIAFSFFSIITWALLSGLAFMKFRQGSASAFAPSFEPSDQPTPYPGTTATSVGNDSYQQPPFDPTTTKSGDPGFSAPPSQAQYQAPSY
ncbi:synaptogyrin-3 [Strongylocentrotus purpuratus]|uniref:Synaptogyrin n=1 Tax=Strongylocentrotus purpuratus TaxID=7668 RepID=A0A7M7G0R9_STRPU|nr:synaptogyrin-3 [Strongylocentrotus purpuratus]|eukprot:XP_001177627.1 PREDICTED: synaptogyrin-3 [Strongylocentrotus purpuratus]